MIEEDLEFFNIGEGVINGSDANLDIAVGDGVLIDQVLHYSCCAVITERQVVDGTTLKIFYDNVNDTCSSTCSYLRVVLSLLRSSQVCFPSEKQ